MISDFLFRWYLYDYGMQFVIVVETGGRLWEKQCEAYWNWSYRWQRFLVLSSYICASICILTSSHIVWGWLGGGSWRKCAPQGIRRRGRKVLDALMPQEWEINTIETRLFWLWQTGLFPLIIKKNIMESGLLWWLERAYLLKCLPGFMHCFLKRLPCAPCHCYHIGLGKLASILQSLLALPMLRGTTVPRVVQRWGWGEGTKQEETLLWSTVCKHS